MKRLVIALLPALLMALMFAAIEMMPHEVKMLESALSPELPLGYRLEGWYGLRTQESAEERRILAQDTRFSKGIYIKLREDICTPRTPPVNVSLVFSGHDMNHSIHRPERCLPTQGHLSLTGRREELRLANGRELAFTRLASVTADTPEAQEYTHHIHYYVFVGNHSILSSHIARALQDICDRTTTGRVQRWAYFQVGTQWGGRTGCSEARAEAQLREFIAELLPCLINWEALGD